MNEKATHLLFYIIFFIFPMQICGCECLEKIQKSYLNELIFWKEHPLDKNHESYENESKFRYGIEFAYLQIMYLLDESDL